MHTLQQTGSTKNVTKLKSKLPCKLLARPNGSDKLFKVVDKNYKLILSKYIISKYTTLHENQRTGDKIRYFSVANYRSKSAFL